MRDPSPTTSATPARFAARVPRAGGVGPNGRCGSSCYSDASSISTCSSSAEVDSTSPALAGILWVRGRGSTSRTKPSYIWSNASRPETVDDQLSSPMRCRGRCGGRCREPPMHLDLPRHWRHHLHEPRPYPSSMRSPHPERVRGDARPARRLSDTRRGARPHGGDRRGHRLPVLRHKVDDAGGGGHESGRSSVGAGDSGVESAGSVGPWARTNGG
jgi:hypothetical protein